MASALRLPGVLPYVIGRLFQELGRSILAIALGWQIYERTGSAFMLGLVGLVQVVPVVGLVTRAGAAADRYPRKSIGAVTQLVLSMVALGIAAISYSGVPIHWVYLLLVVAGTSTAYASPAISALMPELVPTAQLVEVNAWATTTWQLAATAGPAVAGLLLGWLKSATPLYVMAAIAYFALAVITWLLPTRATMPEKKAQTGEDIFAGLRFVFRTKELLGAITLDLFAMLLGGVNAIMPIFAKDILHVGPRGLGWLLAAPAMGSFAAAVAQARWKPLWDKTGHVLLFSVAGFGVATLGFALSTSYQLSLTLLFLTGAFDCLSVVIRRTLEQLVTPDRLRGRVGAVHYVFLGLSNELGEFESGVSAALLGAAGSAMLGGVGTLVVVGMAAAMWPELRAMGRLVDLQPREALAREVLGEDPPPPTSIA